MKRGGSYFKLGFRSPVQPLQYGAKHQLWEGADAWVISFDKCQLIGQPQVNALWAEDKNPRVVKW